MTARTIMVQGTASSVGKSIVTAALCRLFVQEGLRVAPFKSQNMALNAFVTPEGGEIGRAQAVQAAAARVTPTVDMNPILLKPEGDSRSQVVVLGKPLGSLSAIDYQSKKPDLREVVAGSLSRLRADYDVVVIEGAGSPAEINLKPRDIVNMFVAELADAPVLLVGDIDRGGVFAAFVGTLELLEAHERARIAAFVINKFRGDIKLLESGLQFLHERTGVPVLGVLPYLQRLQIADEDSVSLDDRRGRKRAGPEEVEIAVVRLPRISNYDDFQPLEHEPGVVVRFVEHAREFEGADLVVLPGTKSTLSDLTWLQQAGMATAIKERAARAELVLGVCGGCQMLGMKIIDPHRIESDVEQGQGLGLLQIETEFGVEKQTTQLRARAGESSFLSEVGAPITGYEIHMGRVSRAPGCPAAFSITERNGREQAALDGARSSDGVVVGTMIHGLFENESVRRSLIGSLRRRKGLAALGPLPTAAAVPDEFDRIAGVLRANVDMKMLLGLVGR